MNKLINKCNKIRLAILWFLQVWLPETIKKIETECEKMWKRSERISKKILRQTNREVRRTLKYCKKYCKI